MVVFVGFGSLLRETMSGAKTERNPSPDWLHSVPVVHTSIVAGIGGAFGVFAGATDIADFSVWAWGCDTRPFLLLNSLSPQHMFVSADA